MGTVGWCRMYAFRTLDPKISTYSELQMQNLRILKIKKNEKHIFYDWNMRKLWTFMNSASNVIKGWKDTPLERGSREPYCIMDLSGPVHNTAWRPGSFTMWCCWCPRPRKTNQSEKFFLRHGTPPQKLPGTCRVCFELFSIRNCTMLNPNQNRKWDLTHPYSSLHLRAWPHVRFL